MNREIEFLQKHIKYTEQAVEDFQESPEELESYLEEGDTVDDFIGDQYEAVFYFKNILDYLQAMKVVAIKDVNISVLVNSPDLKYYNYHVSDWRKLSEEEFNLLKKTIKAIRENV